MPNEAAKNETTGLKLTADTNCWIAHYEEHNQLLKPQLKKQSPITLP